MAAQGLADKEIALKMGISMGTVRTYWQRMRDKTNSHSRSEILSRSMQERHAESVEELQDLRDRMLAVFQGAAVGIALLTYRDEIVEANPAFARQVGASESELVGSKLEWTRHLSSGDSGRVFGGHRASRHEVKLRGEQYWVVTLVPMD